MPRSPRSVLTIIAAVCFLPLAVGALSGTPQTPELRLISAANVTVRQHPSSDAAPVAQLPLGTEVRVAGDSDIEKTWVHVALPDGQTGWVLARLTRPLDPFWKWHTYEQVIVERLKRKGDGFSASAELVSFIERIAESFAEPESRARMDLHWLRALQQALTAVPVRAEGREPYASWLTRYKDWAAFDEPGGGWQMDTSAIWNIRDARAGSGVADDIAWFAVTVGLTGECEGHVTCYLEWRNRLQGEYLRRHPAGAHAADAVTAIGDLAKRVNAQTAWHDFDPRRDCAPLSSSADALHQAVSRVEMSPARDETLAALGALRSRCAG